MKIVYCKITFGFVPHGSELETPRYYKKGVGRNLLTAIRDLFDKKGNHTKSDEMSAILGDVLNTYNEVLKPLNRE